MFNLKSKIDARLEARRNGESGLALLDVLLGMAIFALIAVIAVQAMGQFRQRAYVTQVTSDVKQVATGIEAYLTGPGVTTAPAIVNDVNTDATLTAIGANLTTGNVVDWYIVSGSNYVICVDHGTDAAAYYDSVKGKVTKSANGACSATPADYAAAVTAAA